MNNIISAEPGSFRDPAGNIFYYEGKILRLLNKAGQDRYNFLKKGNLINKCFENDFLIKSYEVNDSKFNSDIFKNKKIIEHEKINYISYPYEWSFDQLKDAALHHLNFHLFLLDNNATLIDGSAYNIQFNGYKPVFIDLLSIKEYSEGEYWNAHKQCCENVLNPLILK